MSANYYAHGEWNCICQRCGFKTKSSRIRKEWTGLRVCVDRCWEERNQQDLLRAVTDKQTVPFALPEGEDRWDAWGAGILLDSSGNPILDSDGQYILVG